MARALDVLSLRVTLPLPTNLANRGRGASRNGRQLAREKKAYLAQCDAWQAAGVVPPPPPRPLARVGLRSVLVLGGAMDDDNAMLRHKWPLDWLRTRGYVAADDRRCLRWLALPEQVVTRGADPQHRVTLTLTPDSAEARAALCAYLGVADPEGTESQEPAP